MRTLLRCPSFPTCRTSFSFDTPAEADKALGEHLELEHAEAGVTPTLLTTLDVDDLDRYSTHFLRELVTAAEQIIAGRALLDGDPGERDFTDEVSYAREQSDPVVALITNHLNGGH